MAFDKGHTKKGGREKGVPNKNTATVKETFARVFNELQESKTANLKAWAEEQPTEFYKLASKLIPTEVSGKMEVETKQVFKIGNIEIEL
jgi:hypothetical protein